MTMPSSPSPIGRFCGGWERLNGGIQSRYTVVCACVFCEVGVALYDYVLGCVHGDFVSYIGVQTMPGFAHWNTYGWCTTW